MATKKSGRELVEKLYRNLERLYPIKIVDGEVELVRNHNLTHPALDPNLDRIVIGVQALESSIAKIPKPERPVKKPASRAKSKALKT